MSILAEGLKVDIDIQKQLYLPNNKGAKSL